MKFTVRKQADGRKLFDLKLKCKTVSVGSVCDSEHGSSFPAVVVSVTDGAARTYRALGRACQKFGVTPQVELGESVGRVPHIIIRFVFTGLTKERVHYIQKALPNNISVPASEKVGPRDQLQMGLVAEVPQKELSKLREAVFRKKALFVRFQTEGPDCIFYHFSAWCRDGDVTYTMPSGGGGVRRAA